MKKTRAPRVVTIAVTTTVTIIFWIFFGLYSILTIPPKVDIDQKLLSPLNPVLDNKALSELKNKVFFEEEDVANTPLSFEVLITTPSPEEILITPNPSEIPTASEGGQLP